MREACAMSYPPQPPSQFGDPQSGPPQAALPPEAPRRPWNVTLVAILAFLIGLFDVAIGVGALLYRDDLQLQDQLGLNSANVVMSGGVLLVIGAIILLLSFGLFGGSRLSRGVIALFSVLRIALAAIGLILAIGSNVWSVFLVEIGLAVLILIMLYAGSRTKAFFARG
jgi:hypothetical protein